MAASQTLRQFIEMTALPARIKVTEGYQDPLNADWDFSNGDVLDLRRVSCPTVVLNFFDPETGDDEHMSVSTQSPCLFKILPYIPDTPMYLDRPVILHGVEELIHIWPLNVAAEADYRHQYQLLLSKGEKIKLKRLLNKKGGHVLECKVKTNPRLVHLPMNCNINFKFLAETTAFSLSEIAEMPGKVKRRIRFSDDMVNKTLTIPGVPPGFAGDMFMEPPVKYVEISPEESPGERFVIPVNLNLTVEARDEDYTSSSFKWYPLEGFLRANNSKLPMVVQLTEWEEEPISLQAIRVSIGNHMVLHGLEDVNKVLCKMGDIYFTVPLSYDGLFTIKPQVMYGIDQVVRKDVKRVKVIRSAASNDPSYDGVVKGETLQIVERRIELKESQSRLYDEAEVVVVRKNSDTNEQILPIHLAGEYEEVLDIPASARQALRLSDLVSGVLPIMVELTEPPTSCPPNKNPIPLNHDLLIKFMYQEKCVLASKNVKKTLSCPVPARTVAYVRYTSKYPKKHNTPELSPLSTCPEEVSEKMVHKLEAEVVYQLPDDSIGAPPAVPPRKIPMAQRSTSERPKSSKKGFFHKKNTPTLPTIPSGKQPMPLPRRELPPLPDPNILKVFRSISNPTPQSQRPEDGLSNQTLPASYVQKVPSDDELDYEDVSDIKDYSTILAEIFGDEKPPMITVPSDANVRGFTWKEMVSFLHLSSMPPKSLSIFAKGKIDGVKFSKLDNFKLSEYGINFPMVRHYRNRSRVR